MRISHVAIYQALYVEGRGALSSEYLCHGRDVRCGYRAPGPAALDATNGASSPPRSPSTVAPAEVTDRQMPGHRESQ